MCFNRNDCCCFETLENWANSILKLLGWTLILIPKYNFGLEQMGTLLGNEMLQKLEYVIEKRQ